MSDTFRAAQARSAAIEEKMAEDPASLRMLTGDRPTGSLHIGHYFGSIKNRLRLQDSGAEIWQLIADYQVITDREVAGDIAGSVRSLLLDNIAAGLDPERATIFTHSSIPALNQLMLPFLSLVSVAELQRNPTVKDEAASAGITSIGGLLLTYPVHQAADILFCKANVVPVGRDQLPHLEQTRVIARRFNDRYAAGLPRARRPPVRGPTDPRHRRHQDEQVQGQRRRAADERRRDGQEAQGRQDGQRPGHHLRPRGPSRGRQPAAPRRALRGRRSGRDRRARSGTAGVAP